MNDTSNKNANSQSSNDPTVLIKEVQDELTEVHRDIDNTNAESKAGTEEIENKVNRTVKELDGIYADLDKVEADANDEFDTLILEQATEMDKENTEDES